VGDKLNDEPSQAPDVPVTVKLRRVTLASEPGDRLAQ